MILVTVFVTGNKNELSKDLPDYSNFMWNLCWEIIVEKYYPINNVLFNFISAFVLRSQISNKEREIDF